MYHHDVRVRKIHTGIGFHQLRVAPLLNVSQENAGQRFGRKVERSADAGNPICRDVRSQRCGKVQDSGAPLALELFQLRVAHGTIRGAEIDGALGHLVDPCAGTERLIALIRTSLWSFLYSLNHLL